MRRRITKQKFNYEAEKSQGDEPIQISEEVEVSNQSSDRNSKRTAKSQQPKQSKKQTKKGKNRARSEKPKESIEFDVEIQKAKKKEYEQEKDQENYKRQIVKGSCPVDEYFQYQKDYHVLETGGVIYDCLLNQTNINGDNNNNKFYIVQVLESDKQPYIYYFHTRWGRIGQKGQIISRKEMKSTCQSAFSNKVYEKNISGDYRIIQRAKIEQQVEQSDNSLCEESQLAKQVKELLDLIFDKKMMDRKMLEIGYDSKKMPLGNLGAETIQKGYSILKKIALEISGKCNETKLAALSSDFYSYIPHNFGFSRPPKINTMKSIKEKIEMLASLEQIEVAMKLLNNSTTHSYDTQYSQLKCDITPILPQEDMYKLIVEYVNNTHAPTHNSYGLEVLEMFELNKQGANTDKFDKLHNKMLLWHGSRLTNYGGILSQGLRIAPPEAPVTGYMFGKGVYFADMVSKSANYCGASKNDPIALILLCEVALGDWQDRYKADYYASTLDEGKSSTRGVGKTMPGDVITVNGIQVPSGHWVTKDIKNTELLYNEYIVYDVSFLPNNLEKLLAQQNGINQPSYYLKKFGPFALSLLLNPELEYGAQLNQHFETNCNQKSFLNTLSSQKGTVFQYSNKPFKVAQECMACALIVDNPNLQNIQYSDYLTSSGCSSLEAASLAYFLILQKLKQWEQTNEELVLKRLRDKLEQPIENKVFSKVQSQQILMTEISTHYPEFLKFTQGKSYMSDLPIDYFVGSINIPHQSFYFENEMLVHLKVNDKVFAFFFMEEFQHQPLSAFFNRFVYLENLRRQFPTAQVIWCNQNTKKEEILDEINKYL